MLQTLLATKLHIPERPGRAVARARLTDALENGVARSRLTLVAAPAGFGKTTLLADWARTTNVPVAWLSLSSDEDDPDGFLRYLLAAWERIEPEVAGSPLAILLGSPGTNHEAVLAAFLNAAAGLQVDQALILDDYHLIQDPAIHESLAYLLDNLPPRLHFVIGTRAEPDGLPLARYRARGQLFQIHAEELRFTLAEAVEFLNRAAGSTLDSEAIQQWHQQLEGWAAGLQLAALSGLRPGGGAIGAADLSGRQRHIADYLAQEVLTLLPAEVQAFLLRTSILDRLTAPLAEVVTGTAGGQPMLERLERENLFVQALDDERRWFRYHPLFASFLQAELEQRHAGEVAALHRRAAVWHLEHDQAEAAFRHAVAGEDPERVVEVVDRYFNAKLNGGELKTLRRWADSLPAAWYAAYPVLSLMRVGLLAYTGEFQAGVQLMDEIEQQLAKVESDSARGQMARVHAIRCLMACAQNDLERAERYADRALRSLPETDLGFRPGIYGALGDSYRQSGRWAEARACYLKALASTAAPSMRVFSPHILGALADLELRRGRLRAAFSYWRQALQSIQDPDKWGYVPLPVIGWVYIRTGELLYEWNRVAEAWDHISRGLEHAELGGDVRAMIAGYICAGRLKLAEGERPEAASYLERARPLVEKAQFPDWLARFQRLQLECWLADEQLRRAMELAETVLQDSLLRGQPEGETAALAAAQVLIAKGDAPSLEHALSVLERLRAAAEADSRGGIMIEALALQALAHWRRSDSLGALADLERALHAAEPEGYIRLFADLGLPMLRLLQQARARKVMPEYVETLLGAFASQAAGADGKSTGLPEPLTEREVEVLRLMAAGLTNREIAEKLVISAETVKKHGANIYGKLGAGNRTQAVARARALDLLD